MNRKLAVYEPFLSEEHKDQIRTAAEEHGFEVRMIDSPESEREFLMASEVIFGQLPEIAGTSTALKWLCTPFAGVDRFLAEDAFANPEAMLSNSSGAYGVTISEHSIMLLLDILRRQPEYRRIVADHEWRRDLMVRSIRDSRITLLGTGDIGLETAIRLKAFSPACITGVNRYGRNPDRCFDRILTKEQWEEILPETDVLIISLPGTQDTFHMVGAKQLSLLPDEAVIINVGRGTVIDQEALIRELKSGRLYAGLDVFEKEPLEKDDPVWELPNLLITPHTAGNMTLAHTVNRIVEMFIKDLDHYCAGEKPEHLIDRARGY